MQTSSIIKSLKTLKVKVKLDRNAAIKLETLSNEHRQLYNHLLEYTKSTSGCDFKALIERAKDFRNQNCLTISAKSAQNTARAFIANVKSFYALKKKDPNARFPNRFKSHKYFCSFTHDVNGGNLDKFDLLSNALVLRLENKYTLDIELPTVVDCKVNENNLRTVTFHKDQYEKDYYLSFTYEVPVPITAEPDESFLSIDLGLKSIATCFSNVETLPSFSLENSRFKNLTKRIEQVQSLRDTTKKGSRRYKKLKLTYQKLSEKKSNKTKDFQHKVAKEIVNLCKENNIKNLIIGDIKTKKLTNSKVASKGLNKSTQNEGTLSRSKSFLCYKAKEQGLKVSLVNEAFTSQTNCLTNQRNLSSDLSIRTVQINENLSIDRDLNSAVNIAKKNMPTWFRHFDEAYLTKVNDTFQEMYYDTKLNRLKIVVRK